MFGFGLVLLDPCNSERRLILTSMSRARRRQRSVLLPPVWEPTRGGISSWFWTERLVIRKAYDIRDEIPTCWPRSEYFEAPDRKQCG